MRSVCGLVSMVAALVLCLLLASATAARVDQQLSLGEASEAQPRQNTLMTYYIDASKPIVELSSRGSGRTDRTGLTVRMSEASVSKFIPVMSPRPSGMTHEVSNTWEALKNLATMFTHARVINQQNPTGPRMFPRGAVAVQAAADAAAAKTDIASLISAAEARDHRSLWAETSPGSVLLLPYGGSTAAVADIMDVSYDQATGLMSLELDLVHQPHTMSEFEPHGKQTLDADSAHYHFATAPGVTTNAHALIKSLKESTFHVQGVHMFFKAALNNCRRITQIVADNPTPQPGDKVNVTVTFVREACPTSTTRSQTSEGITDIKFLTNCVLVAMLVSGPVVLGEYLDECSKLTTQSRASVAQQVTLGGFGGFAYKLDEGQALSAWVTFTVQGNGPVVIRASLARSDTNGQPPVLDPKGNLTISTLILNAEGQAPVVPPVQPGTVRAVAKLLLSPAKAYRHCGDPITVAALALNATGAAVVGAKLAFSVQGDCKHSGSDQIVKTTDATGCASFTIYGDKPEAITVVAAAVGADGAPVLSHPSNLFFFEERQHADRREREYYEDRSRGRDADMYAATASLRAVEALMKPVSQSN